MTTPKSKRSRSGRVVRGSLLAASGVVGLASAVLSAHLRWIGITVALLCFLLSASLLSKAAAIADQMTDVVGKRVQIEVWGQPLESSASLQVHSVRVLSAGLHIYLQSTLAASPRDLKIAQPSSVQFADAQLVIAKAAYVSLAGKKLGPSSHQPALRLSWSAA